MLTASAIEKKIQKIKGQYMKELDLNGSDLPVFLVLALASRPLTLSQIGANASLDKAQVSRAMHKMDAKGMLVKSGQGVYKAEYALSEKGRRQAGALMDHVGKIVGSAHQALPEQQWQAYYGFAQNLMRQLDEIGGWLEQEEKR